eukprot:scaffold297904_cov31-Tisochrysis_lutea.AAC.2
MSRRRMARRSGRACSAVHRAHGSGDCRASAMSLRHRSLALSVFSANRLRGDCADRVPEAPTLIPVSAGSVESHVSV